MLLGFSRVSCPDIVKNLARSSVTRFFFFFLANNFRDQTKSKRKYNVKYNNTQLLLNLIMPIKKQEGN